MVFLCSISIWAENYPGVKLQFASGEQIVIQLDEDPLFVFENDDVCITTSKRILQCNSEELLGFTHVNADPSSINVVNTDDVFVYFSNDGIVATNLKPHSQISIFTQDGKLVCSSQADGYGILHANFVSNNGVVYIIKSSSTSFKMIKR